MIGALRKTWDRFRGSGESAVTVPPMDGALLPNQILEHARAILEIAAPDNLAAYGGKTCFSSANVVYALDAATGDAREIQRFDETVTALGAGPDGALAVGLASGTVIVKGGPDNGRVIETVLGKRLVCVTALLFEGDGNLLIAQGSSARRPGEWKHDLMERGSSGSVLRTGLDGGKDAVLAQKLSWPYGLAHASNGAIVVCESWRHRILAIARTGGRPVPVLEDLPGYPARLAPASDGGYWLCVFAPQTQLVAFIQRESDFRRQMMRDIDPDYWAAPSLAPSRTFLEPLQGGAQKHLGMLKPWAPSRSYGLVIHLDSKFRPTQSVHSRADGTRHGVTSCVEANGQLMVTSKGGNVIVTVDCANPSPRSATGP